jgi:plasmid stabilization system protein ParE
VEYQVDLTPRADRDLENIRVYLQAENPENSDRFCFELLEAAFSLRTFPERCPGFKSRRAVRKLAFGNYLVIYRFYSDERRVEILRFWHSAREQRNLRLKEEASAYSPFSALATTEI